MPARNCSSKRLTYECLRMIMITRLEIAASAAAAAVAWYDYYLLNESELLMTSLTIFVSASSIPAVSSTASSKVGAFKSHHLKLICIFCVSFLPSSTYQMDDYKLYQFIALSDLSWFFHSVFFSSSRHELSNDNLLRYVQFFTPNLREKKYLSHIKSKD